ncbi:MAG TPA: hypothetical protein ENI05_07595 [Porticoccus sp.]|nr:hypothetical protein [Porticoccus sp.]
MKGLLHDRLAQGFYQPVAGWQSGAIQLSLEDALQNEFSRSVESLKVDGLNGASTFAGGKGRHGSFKEI